MVTAKPASISTKFPWLRKHANSKDYLELEAAICDYCMAEEVEPADLKPSLELIKQLHIHLCSYNKRWLEISADKITSTPRMINNFITKIRNIASSPSQMEEMIAERRKDMEEEQSETDSEEAHQDDSNEEAKPI